MYVIKFYVPSNRIKR